MSKSIIIIGGGIAGLSAGCYGQMNGYRTQIFELHDKPGGLCTSWKRKGYTFDGCIHWLVGTKPGAGLNAIWRELGALQGRDIVNHEEFVRFEGEDGRTFVLYTDIDRLDQHMRELSPDDAKTIRRLVKALRLFARAGEAMDSTGESSGWFGGIKALPFMPAMIKYSRMTIQTFASRFNDPFLREAFGAVFDMPDCPMIALLMTLAWMHNHDAGYPIGGSLPFAQAIERRYHDLGGEIHYRSRVAKILVEKDPAGKADRAVGVQLADGTQHRADVVISAADGHATIFDMLNGRYVDDEIRSRYDEWPIFQPIIQVSLGVARDLSAQPAMVLCSLSEPLAIAGEARERLSRKHYCYDPTMAPAGKSVVVVSFPSNHAYWQALSADRERYEAEKKDIAIKVIDQLDKRLPGLAEQVEVVDVATPLTFERYTGNWQGSMEGWLPTTETMGKTRGKSLDRTLPGLTDFYMIGQWVEPGGGLPPAALSGHSVIRMICKQEGRPFETRLP